MRRYIACRPFMTPLLVTFVVLQSLDVLTTLMGLKMGAVESSTFIGGVMARFGAVSGLLVSKLIASLILVGAMRLGRSHLIVFVNCWFTCIVSWNLLMIGASLGTQI